MWAVGGSGREERLSCGSAEEGFEAEAEAGVAGRRRRRLLRKRLKTQLQQPILLLQRLDARVKAPNLGGWLPLQLGRTAVGRV